LADEMVKENNVLLDNGICSEKCTLGDFFIL
jgi:hypothetical protein